jgi:hypothetical protein
LYIGLNRRESPLVQDINYYADKEHVTVEKVTDRNGFDNFKAGAASTQIVSRSTLKSEVNKVLDEIGFCRVYWDVMGNRLYISGIGADETKRYCFYCEY